jgi:hypothetical protein
MKCPRWKKCGDYAPRPCDETDETQLNCPRRFIVEKDEIARYGDAFGIPRYGIVVSLDKEMYDSMRKKAPPGAPIHVRVEISKKEKNNISSKEMCT